MSEPEQERSVRLLVSGRVQGVGFRYHTLAAARRLGLVGWVKNLAGGEVEVRVTGPDSTLEALRRELRRGPPGSRVDALEETALESPSPWTEFRIVY
jgi:acylphosphatase